LPIYENSAIFLAITSNPITEFQAFRKLKSSS
jgi:hypothetical protein